MDDLLNLTIKSFRGGISSEGDKGPRGAFRFGYGLNIHEGRDSLKCNQKLKKDSGSVVVDLPLAFVNGSDGNKYAFGDTGKVYRKSGGSWTLVYTEAGGKITGAVEFKSTSGTWILYSTQTKLRKISLANAGGTWTGNVSDAGTFTHANANTFHTMLVAIGAVMICDGPYIALYDFDDAFNATALTQSPGLWGKVLLERSTESVSRLIIGNVGEALPEGWFTTWDGSADSWLTKKDTQGGGINGMGFLEGGVIAQVGDNGLFKFWNFGDSHPFGNIPDTGSCYPGGTAQYKGLFHIGMNGGTKNGVYSIGRIDKNDPMAKNLEYVPSHGKLTGTEIGAIISDGDDLYVGWKDGSTYGIDVTDSANKAVARYESLIMNMGRAEIEKFVQHIKVVCAALPANATIEVYYRASRVTEDEDAAADDDGWILASMGDDSDGILTTGMKKGVFDIEAQGEEYEVALVLTPSGNNGPEVYSINNYFAFDNSI